MILRKVTLVLATLSLPVAAVAKDLPAEVLERDGKWDMHYADGACQLFGVFGSGTNQVILRLSRIGPDESPRVSLFGKRFEKLHGAFVPASVYFLPTTTIPDKGEAIVGTSGSGPGKLAMVVLGSPRFDNRRDDQHGLSTLPPVDLAVERAVTRLHVEVKGTGPLELNLPSLANPMAAMRKCSDSLIREWGFDPAELAARKSRAEPATDVKTWVRSDDWPTKVMGYERSAMVGFRATVDESGTVTDCVVLEVTKPVEIGPLTCKFIKRRGKFKPSLDAAGKPIKDFWINNVFWRSGY